MRQSMQARHMARRHRRGRSVPKLNLVSLMDIFTILVFFLMVNSSDVEVLQSPKGIKLPESVAEKKPDEEVVVMVSNSAIMVGGRHVASVDEAVAAGGNIEGLTTELKYLAERRPYRSPEEAAEGRDITIMGDSAIPYTLLKQIMTTVAAAEYRNISLAVSQISSEPSESAEAAVPATAEGG